jgi:hypothetical protein
MEAVMEKRLDKGQFWDAFKNRAVVVAELPHGLSRDLAAWVNETEGRGDDSLRTRAEYSALFDLVLQELAEPASASLPLVDDAGRVTAAGQAVDDYTRASKGKEEFFDQDMHLVEVTGWPEEHLQPEEPVDAPDGARFAIWPTDPSDARHIPPPDEDGVLFATTTFSLMNSGNRTLRVPKRSWKVEFESRAGDDRLVGMSRLNLKAMYNDPSQMREALAWRLFDTVGIPSSRHTFAKLAINGRYRGLFSLIEQVDGRFLKDHFGSNDKGNLYKAYCGDLGCATLERRVDGGDDGGRQYRSPAGSDDATYRLKTNEDDPAANTYDDLAALIRTINGIGLQGGDGRFDTDEFRDAVERILNARAFLRWAGANLLLGSWDNYFATPANYYLYNSGYKGGEDDFVASPYFTFIPWDYDNSLGLDYFDTAWHYTDIVDWPSNTGNYHRRNPPGPTSRIPLVQNLLQNRELLRYYLDHLEHLLDTWFNPDAIAAAIGSDGGGGLWDRVSRAAYLESDTPHGQAFTGRQFSNDEVYRSGCLQHELRHGDTRAEGICHYVRMRYDSARGQLATLRATHPAGASGATFSGMMEAPPPRR